jgi:hypothetical protein
LLGTKGYVVVVVVVVVMNCSLLSIDKLSILAVGTRNRKNINSASSQSQ